MTKINANTSSSPGLTYREIQVLLKNINHHTKLDRNLLITTPNVNSSLIDSSICSNDIDMCNQNHKQTKVETNSKNMDGSIVTNMSKEKDETTKTKTSKPFACTLIMDLLFEEFDSKNIEEYVGKPLKVNAGKVYIYDEKATKELNLKIDDTNRLSSIKCNNLNNQIPKRKPPPLPMKPNNLLLPELTYQTFPIHKAFSLVEPLAMGEFQAPQLPKRNNPTKKDLPPTPPIRTTSMVKPEIIENSPHLSNSTIKSLDIPIAKSKRRSLFRLHERNSKNQTQSMPKINIDTTFVNKTTPVNSSIPAIQTFTKDDIPYVDDPALMDYQIQISDESLYMTEPEEAIKTSMPKIFPSLQFHSLPRIMTIESNDQIFSKSYHNLDVVCSVEDSDSDEDEHLNHYEKISPNYENDLAMSLTREQRKTKVLTKNELLITDPSFFDFEISPNKKSDQLSPNIERMLKSLFHQYDVLEEVASARQSNGCEKFLTTACDKEGNLYFIPKFALKNFDDVAGETWFYPLPMTPLQATCFLKDLSQFGSFMVYQSTDEQCSFYLSVCVTDDVIHYKIEQDELLNYGICGSSRKFPSLKDLIEFYKSNRDSLVARLKRTTKEVNMTIKPGHHYPTRHEIDRKKIKFSSYVLRIGHFGTICVGTYENRQVSIEVLELQEKYSNGNICDKEDALIEMISILDSLTHQNIIKMIGLSCQVYPCYFISEFSTFGNLKNYLKQNPNIDPSKMIGICMQMCAALSHLESKSYIIHRNITCSSFLVFDGEVVKLSEFHKARKVTEDVYISSPSDPILVKWASPEVLIDQIYTTKSDVWSFAVSMWEVFTRGDDPYPSFNVSSSALKILKGELLERPNSCPKQVYELMMQCWRLCLFDRPDAKRINRILTTLKMKYRELVDEKSEAEDMSQSNIKSIPEEEAPVAGIVKLRKKFFTQKTEGHSNNRHSHTPKQTNEPSKNVKIEHNNKELKKNDRIFSLSDLSARLRNNDESKRNLRAQHCKSFQADTSPNDKSRLNDTSRPRSKV